MKKFLSALLLIVFLISAPFAARAEGSGLTVIPPDKSVYYIGEAFRPEGCRVVYNGPEGEVSVPLSDTTVSGYHSNSAGIRHLLVRYNGLSCTFPVAVLTKKEPVLTVTDLFDTHWAYATIAKCMKAGILEGYENKMRPAARITRAEMAQLIYNTGSEDPLLFAKKPNAAASFRDTPRTAWYYRAVEACRKAALLFGDPDGYFRPGDAIKREDALLMIARIRYGEDGLNDVDIEAKLAEYPIRDFDAVSEYARQGVAAALGLAVGDNLGYLHPQDPLTRAEAAVLFANMYIPDPEGWSPPAKPVPAPEPPPEKVPLVYLSPENRVENAYTGVNTNESDQMYRVANAVKALLEKKGYRVVLPGRDIGIHDRGAAANAMGADLYIAIHSNAGGGEGTVAFYNGTYTAGAAFQKKYRDGKATNRSSKEMATEIYRRVAAISPGDESKRSEPLKEDYVCLMESGGTPYVEVRIPEMANVLLEVEFHDKAPFARWIVDHTAQIADAIAQGAIAYWDNYGKKF